MLLLRKAGGTRIARAVLGLALVSSSPAQARTELVDGGFVEGETGSGLAIYRGVPFAAPPVGDLRWRPPQPVRPWRGVRKAKQFAPACMQRGVSMPGEIPPATSEDCLYLNVWAPTTIGSQLPVIVWIHGGGWTNGSASMPLYWGDALARRGAVVVTIAYRLGPLGFLAHPELTSESSERSSGNYGLADQIAALEWVQRNAAAFGGDPDNVTIAGQSAGGMSVSILMSSPRAKGLFHRAIGQSGGLFEPLQIAPHYLLSNAERDGVAFAASVGAATLGELRALDAEALLGERAGRISHPVIEPVILPRPPFETFVAGSHSDVPTLVGYNAEEARSLTNLEPVTADNFSELLRQRWGALPTPIVAAYPFASDAEAKSARARLERDLRFGWDMWTWARLQARHGSAPAYAYLFAQRPPFPEGSVYQGWGATHFAELWYTFGHLDQEAWPWSESDRTLADAIAGYWVNFARNGNPNGPGLAPWPRFHLNDQRLLRLVERIEPVGPPDAEALAVFDQVYSALRAAQPTAAPLE
jgi:para-nitrobenzyl esterase